MWNIKAVALATGGMLAFSAPAFAAVTVVNETDQTHTVTFDHGAEESKHELEPNGTVEEACPEGCGVRFGAHDAMASDGETWAITGESLRPVLKDG